MVFSRISRLALTSGQRALLHSSTELYGRVVAQARDARFYRDLQVPDTAEGRLEMILIHLVLVLRRLQRDGAAGAKLARALAERFVTDVDDCLREMGVSDIKVPQKVKQAAAALYDRTRDYGSALQAQDPQQLAQPLVVHVYADDGEHRADDALQLAQYILDMEDRLANIPSGTEPGDKLEFPQSTLLQPAGGQ